jgi:hypothetical protein
MPLLNAYGLPVPNTDATYLAVRDLSGGFLGGDKWLPNPNYVPPPPPTPISGPTVQPNVGPGPVPIAPTQVVPTPTELPTVVAPAPVPVHLQFNFDTIGQIEYRAIGSVKLPLKLIWVKGVIDSSTVITSDTITFAAALCAPFDPGESLHNIGVMIGDVVAFSDAGVVIPNGVTDPADQARLTAALTSMTLYNGTEGQLPDPQILADRGAATTPAFRGTRYVVVTDWPTRVPFNNLSIIFSRASAGVQGQAPSSVAVCEQTQSLPLVEK